jgi:hypothetical protein
MCELNEEVKNGKSNVFRYFIYAFKNIFISQFTL